MRMLRYVVILVVIAVICMSNYNFNSTNGNEIYKLIFEGTISGIVTLVGLYLTFYHQQQLDNCPCFIVKMSNIPQANNKYEDIPKEDYIDCCLGNSEYARIVEVNIINVKAVWAINCEIQGYFLGAIRAGEVITEKIVLSSDNNNSAYDEICIIFQNIYGEKYYQIIECEQKNSEYVFISQQPKKEYEI